MHLTLLRERTVLGLNGREVVMTDTDLKSVRSARSVRTTTGKVIGMSDGVEIYTFLVARRRTHAVAKMALPHLAQAARVATLDRPIYRSLVRSTSIETTRHLTDDELRENQAWREMEGFWINLKRMLAGTYKHFREENLIGYLKEFEWRKANRDSPDGGFGELISKFPIMPSGTRPVLPILPA